MKGKVIPFINSLHEIELIQSKDKAVKKRGLKLDLHGFSPSTNSLHPFFVRFMRVLLVNLLEVVDLEVSGSMVKVDSFVPKGFMGDSEDRFKNKASSRVDYQKLQSIRWSEARIELVARLLRKVLSFIDLMSEGRIVRIDGFRLKDLNHWMVYGSNMGDFFPFLRWHCNLSCIFCYQDSTHPMLRNLKPHISEREIYTRLRYYSPRRRTALFDQRFFEMNEIMTHPHFLDVLRKFREKDSSRLMFLTNGKALTEEMIRELTFLRPVGIRLSLNSANESMRRKIMSDKNPEIAVNSLPLLKAYQIPFAVGILALPFLPLKDLENTIHYASEHDAQYVVIHMPGYSRYINPKIQSDLDRDKSIIEIVKYVRRIHNTIKMPVTFLSDFYERHVMGESKLPVVIKGVVKNSAAEKAGLKTGDRILEVDGTRILAGRQVISALHLCLRLGIRNMSLRIQRDNDILTVDFNRDCFVEQYPYYPFFCPMESRYGVKGMIIDREGLDIDVFKRINDIINKYGARKCLVLTTILMKSVFEELLLDQPVFYDRRVEVETAIPRSNFWGGNIFTGDHFMVTDFIECIEEWVESKGYRPDVVIIPASAFSWACGWKRDIGGKPYFEIERKTKIPVELV